MSFLNRWVIPPIVILAASIIVFAATSVIATGSLTGMGAVPAPGATGEIRRGDRPPLRADGGREGREGRRPPGGERFDEREGPGGALGIVFVVAQGLGFIGIPGLVTYFGYQYLRRSPGTDAEGSGDASG